MSSYIIDVTNTSGDEGTIIADVGFSYTDNLNDINQGQLKISGTGVTKRSLFEIGSIVKIYRNNALGFHGIINGISYLDGGGISADLLGYESWLAKENGAFANSPWSTTASATIASAVIAESNYFTGGTVEAGASIDFRSEATDSLYNALQRLIKRVGQDIGIDYANSEVDILDHKGSSTSVMTLNDGIQLRDMVVRHSYPIGNDVRVFGMSEGQTRIKSDNASYGQDATSKSTYGTIRKDYIDNSVVTATEANALADILVAKWKDPVKVYEFDVMNPNQTLVSGDVIILNSQTKGLNAEEVRIVSIKRGVDAGSEFLTLEVTNKALSTMARTVNQRIAELQNQAKNLQTYDGYQAEYSNQNCATYVGGCSYFDTVLACLIGQGIIGDGACGCSGAWTYLNGSLSVPGGLIQACLLNINSSSIYNYIAGDLILTGCLTVGDYTVPATDGSAGQVLCTDGSGTVSWGAGGGAAGLWCDDTNPYITTIEACGLSVRGDIYDSDSTHSVGVASSPGAFAVFNGACGMFTTCSNSPVHNGACGYFSTRSCSPMHCGACGAFTCVTGSTIVSGGKLNINASSACTFYVSGNGIYSGTLNMTYLDGTCVCGSRRLRIPVGTNCY